jgi:hypothetical protein
MLCLPIEYPRPFSSYPFLCFPLLSIIFAPQPSIDSQVGTTDPENLKANPNKHAFCRRK